MGITEKVVLNKALNGFVTKMRQRMLDKRGWNDSKNRKMFIEKLTAHCIVAIRDQRPEDCIDVANYAMMLYRCLRRGLRRPQC